MTNSRDKLIGSLLDFVGDDANTKLEKTYCQELLEKLSSKSTTQSANDPPPIVGN